ncbi:MAG TPA: lysophospholipid acyltransferase family protein [Burkholderiaceae bacterium]|nr:lysophospholipid acyltransferase family protein [Burkholderiaceae bacterium]
MNFLMRALACFPLWLLHSFGGFLGWLTYVVSPGYRHRFKHNAKLAGIAADAQRAAVSAAGKMLTELPPLWMRAQGRALPMPVTWAQPGLVEAAASRGRGIVFLTPHLGCFEVSAQAYAEVYARRFGKITVLYRPARKAWLRPLVDGSRRREGLDAAPATLAGVRQMIRALRRGESVGLLPDQVPPEGMGEWAPFFGAPAYTMTLAARLVQQTGAAVLLCFAQRLARGRGYLIHLREFTEPLPDDPSQSAAVINRAMESLILECPEQYLWGYHRYKHPRQHAGQGEA